MKMDVAQETHVGKVRSENQDNYAWLSPSAGDVFLVADGMGGAAGGRAAADMAISTIKEVFIKGGGPLPSLLKASIEEANRRIHQKGASGDSRYHKMGTTVVALVVKDGKAYVAHVGDSRIYLYQDNKLQRLTKDHSQVQRMVDVGALTPEEAEDHPDSNIISRNLGSKPAVEVDIREPIKIMPGDLFLQCTDGLCGLVKDPEIAAILSEKREIKETAKRLVNAALDKGGHDNITLQIVSFEDNGSAKASAADVAPGKAHKKEALLSVKTFSEFKLTFVAVLLLVIVLSMVFGAYVYRQLSEAPTKKPAQMEKREKPVVKPEESEKGHAQAPVVPASDQVSEPKAQTIKPPVEMKPAEPKKSGLSKGKEQKQKASPKTEANDKPPVNKEALKQEPQTPAGEMMDKQGAATAPQEKQNVSGQGGVK